MSLQKRQARNSTRAFYFYPLQIKDTSVITPAFVVGTSLADADRRLALVITIVV